MTDTPPPGLADEVLEAAGFRKRYYLVGHPAWPGMLSIWPATEENAAEHHAKYVEGYTPPVRMDGPARPPWIGVRWEQANVMTPWTPPPPPKCWEDPNCPAAIGETSDLPPGHFIWKSPDGSSSYIAHAAPATAAGS